MTQAKPSGRAARLLRWGAGPLIGTFTALWAGLMLLPGCLWAQTLSVTGLLLPGFTIAGACLLAVGVPLYMATALHLRSHRRTEGLVTSGPYRRIRHPLYAIGFLFLAPGVVLLLGSWPLLSVPIFMYLAARLLIPAEERMLSATYGAAYAEYVASTGAFFPKSSQKRPQA